MKLIIDIPDDLYKTKKALPGYMCGVMEKAVQNGTPLEQKTGKWEFVCQHWRKCSECGFSHKFAEDWNYCPDCGAKMVEPRENEVRNETK